MSQAPLVDLAVDAVRVATAVGSATDAGVLRQQAEAALEAFATAAAGADPAAIDDARYALVALIDERALAATSPVRAAWLDRPLQLALYDSFAAGEEFFRRLERWRHPHRAEDAQVLEVFHAWRWRGLPVWVVPAACLLAVGLVWLAGRWWITLAAARLAADLR